MAAITFHAPGTANGPCPSKFCIHTDCQATRRQAASACQHCGKPIGYGVRFYQINGHERFAHAACEDEAIAAK